MFVSGVQETSTLLTSPFALPWLITHSLYKGENTMHKILTVLALLSLTQVASGQLLPADSSALTGAYLGQTPPDTTPIAFAPEFILDGVHSAPAFTPDGNSVYWSRYYTPEGKRSRTQHIFTSSIQDGRWAAPQLASFSGEYSDGGPFITPDGTRLFFYSSRPASPGGEPADEYIADIWYMERSDSEWGEPQRLALNSDKHEGMPSVAADGTLYFQSNRQGVRGIFDIFVSEPAEGVYSAATNIGPPITSGQIEFAPFIAPDESYIIFTYNNRPGRNGMNISFRQTDGTWSEPVVMKRLSDVGSVQRFPGLSHDGKYLFFTVAQNRKSQVYWVDASIIERFRPTE
jgi:Tol biopolymer transport system component